MRDTQNSAGVPVDVDKIIEDRARKICRLFSVDADEIVDPYGPVRSWDSVAYHIYEAILAVHAARASEAVRPPRT